VRWLSRVTPKSLADLTGLMTSSRKVSDISLGSLCNNCRVPIRINLVFEGLDCSWFVEHQLATLTRSSSRFMVAWSRSLMRKDNRTFESSTT
jgi:hypothetical protein